MSVAGVLMRAAVVAVPDPSLVVHIWRHFAVLTIFHAGGLIWDHLFLAREGWPYRKSWKFKVVTLDGFFETGSMPGLITRFR